MPEEKSFDDAGALAVALAQSVADSLKLGLQTRGKASLAVSGGRTPAAFLEALSQKDLDWSQVWVTLADERWVAADHVDSNEALVRRHLLRNQAARANFVGLKNPAFTALKGEADCEAAMTALPQPFDAVVLGMGDDGHIASLFPQAPQLAAGLDLNSGRRCIAVDPVTMPHERMSLTLPALLASRRMIVLITGPGKWDIYQKALQAGPVEVFPVRSILHQTKVPVEVYWCP